MHSLKFVLCAGEVSAGGNIAPVLALYGLDLLKVAKEFNEKSLFKFVKGVPISMVFYLFDNKEYKVLIKFPFFNFYIKNMVDENLQNLKLLDFYNLVCLYSRDFCIDEVKSSKILFSYLTSYVIKLKLVF